ncbi:MAG: hypothetical protein ACTS2F_28860 [Thainema sp.]
MNTPPPSEPNFNQPNAQNRDDILISLQEQQHNLKLSLEELQKRTNQMRGLVQTLITGLVISVVLAIGITGWFAYRLLVQEQIVQRETTQAAEANAELLEQLETVETQLQRQQEQLNTLRDTVPDELATLNDTIQSQQRRLELLQDRIQQMETPADAPEEDS